MNNSDYLTISNNIIEEFKGGNGAIGGGNFAGSGSFGSSKGSTTLTSRTNSIGGGKQYGSAGYASVSPITGAMSGLANHQPNSDTSLGIIKGGAKTGTFTGGSFGGSGKYVIGFPGIKAGSNIPANSMPSLYVKPKPKEIKSTITTGPILQQDAKPYGKIDKKILQGNPGPIIAYKGDNVNHNYATTIRGPTINQRFDLKDKNLTGYYGYQGYGYGFDPWYWGFGPLYPINGIYLNYPDIPFNYEDLMQKEINADYLTNTIQNQIADQIAEMEQQKTENENKENFEISGCYVYCNKYNIIALIATILAIYLILSLPKIEDSK